MPTKPLRPCNHGSCGTLTTKRYCEVHRKRAWANDREARGSAAERGYDAEHERWRDLVLTEHPLCVDCLKQGRTTPSVLADHIVPIDPKDPHGRPELWLLSNGQGLCVTHHNRKTWRERRSPHPRGPKTSRTQYRRPRPHSFFSPSELRGDF